jgi:hypothetical protein
LFTVLYTGYMKTSLLFLALYTGCASAQPSLSYQYADMVGRLNAQADGMKVADSEPFIAYSFSGDNREANEKAVCGAKRSDRAACAKLISAAFQAKLNARYNMADGKAVDAECSAHPNECKDMQPYEAVMRAKHNEGVERARQAALADLRGQYDRALASRVAMPPPPPPMQPTQPVSFETQQPRTDFACMQRCTASGSLMDFCNARCTY